MSSHEEGLRGALDSCGAAPSEPSVWGLYPLSVGTLCALQGLLDREGAHDPGRSSDAFEARQGSQTASALHTAAQDPSDAGTPGGEADRDRLRGPEDQTQEEMHQVRLRVHAALQLTEVLSYLQPWEDGIEGAELAPLHLQRLRCCVQTQTIYSDRHAAAMCGLSEEASG